MSQIWMQTSLPLHGGDIYTSDEERPAGKLLDYSANINPLGLPDSVVEALQSSAPALLHYPDPQCRELAKAIAAYEGVPEEWVRCGNGASDLIYRIAQGLRPEWAMVTEPTFAEYELALTSAGCSVYRHALKEERDFLLDESILLEIPGRQILFLCNPNNPTGKLIPHSLLEKILQVCRQENCLLIVDECFLDFVPDSDALSMKGLLENTSHLLILRAFTKIFAMPGIRLGYLLCSDQNLLRRILEAGPPWSVSAPAQLCGVAAAAELDFVRRSRGLVQRQRTWLAAALRDLGLRVFDGAANFLLFQAPVQDLRERMLQRRILIRDCSNFDGLRPGYYRVAVRGAEENRRLIRGMAAALEPENG